MTALNSAPRQIREVVDESEAQVALETARAVEPGAFRRSRGVFVGNTAERSVNSLERPALAVRPDRFVSPLLKT